jgi:hypothetical protein
MVDDWLPRLFCFAFGVAVGYLLAVPAPEKK